MSETALLTVLSVAILLLLCLLAVQSSRRVRLEEERQRVTLTRETENRAYRLSVAESLSRLSCAVDLIEKQFKRLNRLYVNQCKIESMPGPIQSPTGHLPEMKPEYQDIPAR